MKGWVCAAALLTLACSSGGGRPTAPSCAGTVPPPTKLAKGTHVFIVTVDGMRPELVNPVDAPVLHALLPHATRAMKAKTVNPSVTLPAHMSIVTGLTPEQHGVSWNTWTARDSPLQAMTVFEVARAAGLSTALFTGKKTLQCLGGARPPELAGASDRDDAEVMTEALSHVGQSGPSLMLIHLPGVDEAGHADGWLGDAQRKAMRIADEQIGRLLQRIRQATLAEQSVLIVTADHGGLGRAHDGGGSEDLTVPWIVWGAGVRPQDVAPVCVTATAGVALAALGLEPPPARPTAARTAAPRGGVRRNGAK